MAVTRKQSISVTMTTVKLACRWVMIALRLFLHIPSLNHSCHVGLELALNNLLTIIEWSWAKYCDLSGYWPATEANNWSARHRQITIFCDNRVQNLFYHSVTDLLFNAYLREGVRAHCLSCMSNDRDQMASFPFCSFKRPNTVGRHQLGMSRPLFVGSYLQVTWWILRQWKGRKICIQ